MRRRKFVIGLGLIVTPLSGCSVKSGQSASSNSPNSQTTSVGIPPCPENPDSKDPEALVQFVISFEKYYKTRQIVENEEQIISLQFKQLAGSYDSDPNVEITNVNNGYILRFFVEISYSYKKGSEGTETVHADPPQYRAHYFVNNDTVKRTIGSGDERIDPREKGKPVDCMEPE